MSYLRDLPFDKIKLDQSFVSVLGSNARADGVACAIIDLGHRLDMAVCAEGVETEAQLALLRAQGCDLVQGFLLGRPGAEVKEESASF
jgi:EAL domain-containing protein (putative c-di-GMP-specific phosphodiesterase class I)